MSFEQFSTEKNGLSHEELLFRNEIQAELLAIMFSPNEEEQMVKWMADNGQKLSVALAELEAEHPNLKELWQDHKDSVIEALNEKLSSVEPVSVENQSDLADDGLRKAA